MDWTTLTLATLGGVSTGTFPIFIKTKAVLAADVHPIVFQLYKSGCVCVVGLAMVLIRYLLHEKPVWKFTWWAAASAAAWIPAGLSTIVSVPLIGVGSCVLTTSAVSSSLSFFVFWLVFHSAIKTHDVGGSEVFLAPAYLAGCLVGMIGLVLAQQKSNDEAKNMNASQAQLGSASGDSHLKKHPPTTKTVNGDYTAFDGASFESPWALNGEASGAGHSTVHTGHKRRVVAVPWLSGAARSTIGFAAAALTGAFSALQFGVVTFGRSAAATDDDAKEDEAFDALGSWLASFGASALAGTLLLYGGLSLHLGCQDPPRARPSLHLADGVMALPGLGAGAFWTLGNVLTVLAVQRGGNATVMAQANAAQLICSGMWGLLYYREIRGRPAVYWAASAAFTAAMAVLLGMERA
jgi:hypothetical protein